MDEKVRVLSTDEEIRIVSDPYRLRILNIYSENDKPMTVKEVAVAMEEVPAKVHYHVKKLLSIDILELDHVEVIKGIHAKYYRLVTEAFRFDYSKQGESLSKMIDHSTIMIGNMLEDFKQDVAAAYDTSKAAAAEPEDEVLQDNQIGYYTREICYFNKETFEKMIDDMQAVFEKYGRPAADNDRKYGAFFGVVRKKDLKG